MAARPPAVSDGRNWMDGWMDERMDGCMDGWTDAGVTNRMGMVEMDAWLRRAMHGSTKFC